ncbi:MBL fold metallo-hydrolase [Methylocella silvestris]|uniref:Metallo-beta-lactamase domain-containing protein n=1 Tax=Methylocella silvestris TaxID=199596 RepID=A0A2J7TIQ5_METSI|nr:MBL fold metallo-hydrolase [Methylocella silvestris]PNG26650.1 hypothetical protein CR492_06550 [Methylocella silvestris]
MPGSKRNRYYAGPPSDHFDGDRFFNPDDERRSRGLGALLRWRFSGAKAKWPKSVPSPYVDHPPERVADLRITLIGHASMLIQAGLCNILVDPHWSDRASPFSFAGPKRVNPPGVAFDDLPPIDVVLITHAHYDHLDMPTLRRLWRIHRPRILAPLGNDAIIRRGDPDMEVATGDWGDRFALSDSVAASLTPARHWSARTLSDRNMSLWCGFAIETPAGLIYHVGDTGFGDGRIFRSVRRQFGAPAVAIIPIGAYAPRWFMSPQHVDPAEAVAIMRECGALQALGVHWGAFHLSDEAHDAPPRELAIALNAHGVAAKHFVPLQPGEVWQTR